MTSRETDPILEDILRTATKYNADDFLVTALFINLEKMPISFINWHWHEEIEFLIINNGHANIHFSNTIVSLAPGEGIFINQNTLHSIKAVNDESCSLYVLKFHPSFLFEYHQTILASMYLTPVLTSHDLHYLHLTDSEVNPPSLLSMVNDAIAYYMAKRFGYEVKIKGLLCDIWYQLLQIVKTPKQHATPVTEHALLDSGRIKDALVYIEEHYMNPLTLDDIAASIHISKSECCRCFQRSLGLTPFEYLIKFRIFESTKKMFRNDGEETSIAELSAAVGFNSVSYYNKLFKKYMNCTPTEYRRTIQRNTMRKPNTII